jgi:Ca-activated chloride channel homolog
MAKRHVIFSLLLVFAFPLASVCVPPQEGKTDTTIRVTVDMVQLNVAVTDNKGNYITALRPLDFDIFEDGILQKIATFGEENEMPKSLAEYAQGESSPKLAQSYVASNRGAVNDVAPRGFLGDGSRASALAGASVFILFDTSNYMYRGFVFAQDAISEFVRTLDHPDRVAFYSYSRDFSRASLLSSDRSQVLRGVRSTVAGDDAALYNALLMTLKDAAQFSGRKVIVVFSNGPDNASMVAPEDVRELAQSEGIPIYMISTQEARIDPVSTAVFERMTATTGGKVYFAKNWKDQEKAFSSIREDLAHLYSLSYYPQPNPNRGWRTITVRLKGESAKKYRIRTRSGYRPKTVRIAGQMMTSTP